MTPETVKFIEFLRAAITPVAMISGVGLLLLTITNRLGRTIDRARFIVNELEKELTTRRKEKENEVHVLYRRSRYLRNSIGFILVGIIGNGLLIPLLFVMYFLDIDLRVPGYVLFLFSIFSILTAMIYFFRDVVLSLNALQLEASDYIRIKRF